MDETVYKKYDNTITWLNVLGTIEEKKDNSLENFALFYIIIE